MKNKLVWEQWSAFSQAGQENIKMWKERLEEIGQEEKRYGQDINRGISEEAGTFIKAVKDEQGIALSEEYLKILRTINGIEYNGFILYGVDEPILNEAPNQHINGLIDCNKVCYEMNGKNNIFFRRRQYKLVCL